jgi:hypothetical protein
MEAKITKMENICKKYRADVKARESEKRHQDGVDACRSRLKNIYDKYTDTGAAFKESYISCHEDHKPYRFECKYTDNRNSIYLRSLSRQTWRKDDFDTFTTIYIDTPGRKETIDL